MKTLGAIVVVLLLVSAGCGYCPPGSRAEIRRNREEFRRAARQAHVEMQRARIDLQRELRNAREDFRREMYRAHRDLHDQFGRW